MKQKNRVIFYATFFVCVASFIITLFVLNYLPQKPTSHIADSIARFYKIDNGHNLITLFSENNYKIQKIFFDNKGPLTGKIERVALFSTSYYPFFHALEATDLVVAVDNPRYSCSDWVHHGVETGQIITVGEMPNPDIELLMAQKVDTLLAPRFAITPALEKKLTEANIRCYFFQEWLEEDPLARSSWVLVLGQLLGKEEVALTVFTEIQVQYDSLRKGQTAKGDSPVSILTGLPWQGLWGIPGGKSYVASLISHAGGVVVDSDNDKGGSRLMSPEEVVVLAQSADIWLVNNIKGITSTEILNQNPLFSHIQAMERGVLYNNTKRGNAFGGNDYYESSVLLPHRLLADLIEIIDSYQNDRATNSEELYYFEEIQ